MPKVCEHFLAITCITFKQKIIYPLKCPDRHLREIDYSLAIVGGPAPGAESRGKSIHSPHIPIAPKSASKWLLQLAT